jgi:hypothetical protein
MSIQTHANTPLDLGEKAQKMVEAAVAVTTGRLHLRSPREALDRLHTDDPAAVAYFRYELARQIAAALLMMDSQVIAVFEDGDVLDGDPGLTGPMRLVIQVRHRTAALRMVIGALDQALGQAFAEMVSEPPSNLIEAIVVDSCNSRLLEVRRDGLRLLPRLLTHRIEH